MKNFASSLFLFITFVVPSAMAQPEMNTGKFTLVIHGGAGTLGRQGMDTEKEKKYLAALDSALDIGYKLLDKDESSLDVVTAVVRYLEDCPLFNAGKGSVFNAEGKHELDASVMDGSNGHAGAVAGVRNIKNPIAAARLVMERSEHVMLTGPGAEHFAEKHGLQPVDSIYFFDALRFEQWKKTQPAEIKPGKGRGEGNKDEKQPGESSFPDSKYGTVGAVALDKSGKLAAATSTGGMTNKKYGRTGDSPIIGAGTYANSRCAISCTGHGEYFIRAVAAYDVAAIYEYKGGSIEDAAEAVIGKIGVAGGTGGLIAVDEAGNFAMPFNTEGMYRGYVKQDGSKKVSIFK